MCFKRFEKTCARCLTVKPILDFSTKSSNVDCRQYHCKQCLAVMQKSWASYDRAVRSPAEKLYRQRNPEKSRERVNRYRRDNPEKAKEQARRSYLKRRGTPEYRLAHAARNRLIRALKNKQKTGSAVADLGCSVAELVTYLESMFLPGMTWENWKHAGWHIDHIRPLASFDLEVREEFLQAVHYSNLQPMWAKDNLRKGQSHGESSNHTHVV